jgi:hypothetical protein
MENDSPNQTTKQLLIKQISEAAKFTDPDFAVTACNQAALALFLYNQQNILGHSISFLVSPAAKTNSQLSLANTTLLTVRETECTSVHRIGAELRLSMLPARGITMKERTLMMGGCFEINSKPGEGTTIIRNTSLRLKIKKNLLKNNPNHESTGC